MKTLAYLLGARALDIAYESAARPRPVDEPLPPIATTPETAAAWRRWAASGRVPASSTAARPVATRPAGAAIEPA